MGKLPETLGNILALLYFLGVMEVQNSTRHAIFYVLMLVQIIVCRLLMCLFFSQRKVQHIGGGER